MIFLFRWLLAPFRDNGHISGQEVNYNNKHAKDMSNNREGFPSSEREMKEAKIH